MVRHYKLKDGSFIEEVDKGTYALVFPNKRYILITTSTGKPIVDIASYGKIELGETTNIVQLVKDK